MDELVLPPKLLNSLHRAAEKIRSHNFIHIFSHYDADGISAGGIIAKTLQRLGIEYQVTLLPVLNDNLYPQLEASTAKCIILSDIGASYIDKLEKMDKDVIVLDHHKTDFDSEKVIYANPHLYGIDGMTSGCGSTMAFLFAITVDTNNWDMVEIAFAGIAGDRQHIAGLKGLNEIILEPAIKKGYVSICSGSLVPFGPLSATLYSCTEPYVRGLSGNTHNVLNLLKELNIEPSTRFEDLSDEIKWKLSSIVSLKLLEQGTSTKTLEEVARDKYYLKNYDVDAEYLSDLLNSCGRSNLGGVGIGVCLGDKNCFTYATEVNSESKREIVNSAVELDNSGIIQMKNIQYFDSSLSGNTGIMCSIAMLYIGDPNKPTIGINNSNGIVKVSSRGTNALLDAGVDLSVAMKTAAEYVGGNGGGHRIASGANFPDDKIEEFLKKLDEIIGEQISSAK